MSESITSAEHKAGFVNIIGSPNVGKSTLMNRLVGERLSIINAKAQTTRHRIMGIVSGESWQIVYSDTPGVLDPAYKLQEGTMNFVRTALRDADVLLIVTTPYETTLAPTETLEKVQKMDIPVLLLINKIDLSDQDRVSQLVGHWHNLIPRAEIHPISALHGFNLDHLLERVVALLPSSPAFFPKDEMTDKPMRFFVAEIIREKILTHTRQEVPYSSEVIVESFKAAQTKEGKSLRRIQAVIQVARDSQKAILIGTGGQMIKRLATDARKDLEGFLKEKVFLELRVKVDKDWRNDERKLKQYGYFDG